MTETAVTTRHEGALAQFTPEKAKSNDAQADALIAFAKRVHDWPLLQDAVDNKLDDQAEFVRWWRENVSVNHGGRRKSAERGTWNVAVAEDHTGISNQQVSRWSKRLQDREKYRADLFGSAWRKAMAEAGESDVRGTTGTGNNQWFTPEEYIELARAVLGAIDLDPATHEIAQRTVRAETYFTEADDGLSREWSGRVWLNPPYAQPAIDSFAEKMASEYEAGRVDAAIMLTHNYTDTKWFHRVARTASAICFTRGRIGFLSPRGEKAAPTQGQAFFYFGSEVDCFADAFGDVGFVVELRR